MNSKLKKNMLIGILVVLLALIAGGVLYYVVSNQGSPHPARISDSDMDNSQENIISYNGKKYVYNKDIKNILFMGVDKTEKVTLKDIPGSAGQADSIMLLRLNQSEKTMSILQISRDTMTSVDVYDSAGEYYTSVDAQICIQYAFGNGDERSCWLMKKKVSELLYQLPVNGCVSLNISGIAALNDLVGQVTLTVPEDYTDIDLSFQKGAEVTLTGEQAEKYVRFRDTEISGSNNQRMERQLQYISAFLKQAKEKFTKYSSLADEILPEINDYIVTDLTGEELNALSDYEYREEKNQTVPGELRQGEIYDEFLVDDEKLYDLLIKMFYKEMD